MPVLTKGAKAAETIAEASRASFAGRAKFFSIGDKKNPTFFRLLTDHDDWLTARVHVMVPTRPKPADFKGDNWPAHITVVCANDVMFRVHDHSVTPPVPLEPPQWEEPVAHYGHCRVEGEMGHLRNQWGGKFTASPVIFAFCVLRELVRDADGQPVGVRDVMEAWKDKDGKEYTLPAVRIMQQKWTNFFGGIKAAALFAPFTTCNRDYRATKEGTEVDVIALDATPDHMPGLPSWKAYEEAVRLMELDLGKSVTEKADPDFHARFFDPSYKWPKKASAKGDDEAAGDEGGAQPAVATAEGEALEAENEEKIRKLKERLAGRSAAAEPAESSGA